MDVVPVLDLLGGHVVRGAGGDRTTYQPVQVSGCDNPGQVAQHLQQKIAATACYVADLDALGGGTLQSDLIATVADVNWSVWLDAGVSNVSQLEQYRSQTAGQVDRWIVALESVSSVSALLELGQQLGEKGIFSIDLVSGKLRTSVAELAEQSPRQIAELAVRAGFQTLILLDVRQVGMRGGNALEDLLSDLHQRWPEVEFISGGGVRDRQDLLRLHQAGCQHALVATALYDETIDRKTVDDARAW